MDKEKVPLPNVIYDRLPNRQAENYKPIVRAKRKLEQDYCIPWFNPGFSINGKFINFLRKTNQLNPYYQTEAFQHFEQVERFLGTYKSVYMKPIHGALVEIFIKYFILKQRIATTVVIAKMKKIN